MEGRATELTNLRSTLGPKFIYSSKYDKLLRANLITGEQSCLQIPGYEFKIDCRWSELPGGSLLITGGLKLGTTLTEVVKIDNLRERAVSSQPPMHTARSMHAAV
jgi:hypothetical protein